MTLPDGVPTFYICIECGETSPASEGFPEKWMLQWFDERWYVMCPCVYKPVNLPKIDYTNPTKYDYYPYYPTVFSTTSNNTTTTFAKPTHKNANQAHLDKILSEIDAERAERVKRWKELEETKSSRHDDATCESCKKYLAEIEEKKRIRREIQGFGKGSKEER